MVSVAVASGRAQAVSLLADLVDYPGPDLAASVHECRALLAGPAPEAAALLDRVHDEIQALPPGRAEELYSSAFELDTLLAHEATCYPYVGHHLLGESYRRSRFMVGLLERYAEHGFEPDRRELPDHLLVMLRFLARCDDDGVASELVGEAILPALARMTRSGAAAVPGRASGRAVYLRLLEAIRLALTHLWPDVEPCAYENAVEGGLA